MCLYIYEGTPLRNDDAHKMSGRVLPIIFKRIRSAFKVQHKKGHEPTEIIPMGRYIQLG